MLVIFKRAIDVSLMMVNLVNDDDDDDIDIDNDDGMIQDGNQK